ncbi:PREDICTED: uncharacterized protein LOC106115722 [Papilio xuthus]|uniref:Uncharacterized protein LOC106115722 n=1 Tax=Papilio xuthus TaxID=66420 RepID=A0AAJ7E672_PAPXU|nr:PREDICTED: uncharacterized protein LOC106115722 [Papilio xuthus]
MGCGCSAEGQTIASYIFMFERFGSSIALTLIVCCMMLTTVGMLSLGIGLGYNYCFVDFKVKKLYEHDTPRRSLIRKRKSIPDERNYTAEYDEENFNIEPTMIIPLDSNISFSMLISKIKKMNKNVTLELLAT